MSLVCLKCFKVTSEFGKVQTVDILIMQIIDHIVHVFSPPTTLLLLSLLLLLLLLLLFWLALTLFAAFTTELISERTKAK